jgi:hypothetical protein
MPFWAWLTSDQNAPTVGALGLILTALAFGVTIWQLWATRREVHRAVEEIDRFKTVLRSEERIQLVVLLTEQIRQAIDLVRTGQAPPVFDMLHRVRQSVLRLSSLQKQAGAEFDNLDSGARSLSDFMTANEKATSNISQKDRYTAISSLRKLQIDVSITDGNMRDSRK